VVLGLGVNGLGVVRALAQENVPVVGVYEQAGEIGRYSRHCRAVSFPDVERDPEGFFRELCALGKQLGDRPVLFPTSDRQLELVSREREPLGKLFRFRLAAHEVLDLLMDKALVLEAARRYGIGGPRTFIFRRPEDLSAAMETLPVPSVAKPRFPWRPNPGRVPKVTLLHSREEIQAFIQRYGESADNLVFQEVIEGGDADHAFCTMYMSSRQRVVGVVTGETIHRYPPNLGRTASCVTRDIPELAEAGERFLAGERYLGLAELEFKRDRRDGMYKLFEVNTRTWAYNGLSPACGVNLVHLAYLEAIAEPLPEEPLRGRSGWTWVNSELEAGFLWKTLKQGRFAGLPWRSFRPKTAHSKFAWDDPQPALRGLFYRVGRLIQNLPGDDAGI
jgi:predicted ATP-grasp superfamily ATP-dependent carboligase